MNKTIHRIYILALACIVSFVTLYIGYKGFSYYGLPVSERYYHPDYDWFKPSGFFGHGLGIVGTILIIIGVGLYILSKKYGFLTRYIRLKYILEFHIFLCSLGPVLILYHTSFKFGGIVSIAFWSMVAVVLSGVIGRFIYIQIPRNLSGNELSAEEIKNNQENLLNQIKELFSDKNTVTTSIMNYQPKTASLIQNIRHQHTYLRKIRSQIKALPGDRKTQKKLYELVKSEVRLEERKNNLQFMQRLFKYWHVAHKPFALIMLVIVTIHIVVTLLFGYTWIF